MKKILLTIMSVITIFSIQAQANNLYNLKDKLYLNNIALNVSYGGVLTGTDNFDYDVDNVITLSLGGEILLNKNLYITGEVAWSNILMYDSFYNEKFRLGAVELNMGIKKRMYPTRNVSFNTGLKIGLENIEEVYVDNQYNTVGGLGTYIQPEISMNISIFEIKMGYRVGTHNSRFMTGIQLDF